VETKKPALAFLYEDLKALRVADTDDDPDKLRKLRAFRSELEQKRIVNCWVTSDELVARVKDSINDLVRRRPTVGWIRGNQALDPEVYRERDELRSENAALKARTDDAIIFPPDIAHGADTFTMKCRKTDDGFFDFDITYDQILVLFTGNIYSNESESILYLTLNRYISDKMGAKRYAEGKPIVRLPFQFEALGIMSHDTGTNSRVVASHFWILTERGRRYVARLNSIHKAINPSK
jgi:hypothetical protein